MSQHPDFQYQGTPSEPTTPLGDVPQPGQPQPAPPASPYGSFPPPQESTPYPPTSQPYQAPPTYGGQQGYDPAPGYGSQQGYDPAAGYGAQQNYTAQPPYSYQPVAEHPQAQTVFILGIIGIFIGIVPFVAWYLGAQARKDIQAGAPYPWSGNLKTGYLLGKIFSIIHIVALVVVILMYVVMFAAFMSYS